jgi:hypothetical protein
MARIANSPRDKSILILRTGEVVAAASKSPRAAGLPTEQNRGNRLRSMPMSHLS